MSDGLIGVLKVARAQLITLGGTGEGEYGDLVQKSIIDLIDSYISQHKKVITIHIWEYGDGFGVNAKQNGRWLEHDDSCSLLQFAKSYAFYLKRKLNASAVYTDWNGKEIQE